MKNLLESLKSQKLDVGISSNELTRLLTNVRDSKELKPSDNFHESIEKVLAELRNTDHATAFLKPVRKSEAPGYDTIIRYPMDLGTMLRKAKAHVYKSKAEFAADLNLIWNNCLTYNTDPNHPLRRATHFMQKKAATLLEKLMDKNQSLPPIVLPSASPQPHKPHFDDSDNSDKPVNGDRLKLKISLSKGKGKDPLTNGTTPPPDPGLNGSRIDTVDIRMTGDPGPSTSSKPRYQHPLPPLEQQPAIIRTPSSMSLFHSLDQEVDTFSRAQPGPSSFDDPERVKKKLRAVKEFDKGKGVDLGAMVENPFWGAETSPGGSSLADTVGPGTTSNVSSPKKKKIPQQLGGEGVKGKKKGRSLDSEVVDAWWDVMGTSTMIGAGMMPSWSSDPVDRSGPKGKGKAKISRPNTATKTSARHVGDNAPGGLKNLMFKNIDTLRRVRKTHSNILTLRAGQHLSSRKEAKRKDRGGKRGLSIPIEGGLRRAESELMDKTGVVLEHAGFEGASKAALTVLNDVAADFLMNVGRTMRYMADHFSKSMTPEEIILHVLFESGITHVRELERYIKEDVVRHGHRLSELDRKLAGVFKETAEVEQPDAEEDEALFDQDGEALMMGDFTDALGGEDFFGFKALGLDQELGLANLSVPSRLFNRKKKPPQTAAVAQEPARVEPSLPFPPPPPFIPLESTTVDRQIGLLQGFYKDKARQAAAPLLPPPPVPIFTPPEDTVLDDFIGAAFTALEDTKDVKKRLKKESSPELPRVPIPDDKPDSSHIKMGPLGQVTLIAPQSSKKKKDKDKKEEEDGPDVKKEKKEKGLPGSKKSKKVTIEGEEGEGKKRKRKDKDGAEGPKTKKKKVVIQPPIHTPLGLSDAPQVTV